MTDRQTDMRTDHALYSVGITTGRIYVRPTYTAMRPKKAQKGYISPIWPIFGEKPQAIGAYIENRVVDM